MKLAIQNNAKILALFAVACTAIVGITYELTKDRIQRQEQKQLLSTLHAIVPQASHNNDMSLDCAIVSDELLGSAEPQTAYIARQDEAPVAAAITTIAPDGYNGKIHLIVAINVDGNISGVRTLKHKETPGLGDKIELRKSNWITTFTGKPFEDVTSSRWAVHKDGGMFDQFTGATITPRAVVKAVKNTALYFNQHKNSLFTQTNACESQQ